MANSGEHTLFDRPRIGAVPQHLEIVVGLEHDEVAAAELSLYVGRHVAQVGGDCEAHSFGGKNKTDRVCGVMRDCEWADGNVPDRKGFSCTEVLNGGQPGGIGRGIRRWGMFGIALGGWVVLGNSGCAWIFLMAGDLFGAELLLQAILLRPFSVGDAPLWSELAYPGPMGRFCEVNGNSELACRNREAADMVLVLVSDQDSVESSGVFTCESHTAEEFAAAQACIDEDAGASTRPTRAAGNDGAVSFGAGGEDGEANHLSSIVLFGVELEGRILRGRLRVPLWVTVEASSGFASRPAGVDHPNEQGAGTIFGVTQPLVKNP